MLGRQPVSTWLVAILVLVAVLVGALIPVLMQLRATLRAAELALKGTLPRVEETLDDVSRFVVDASQVVEGLQSTTRIVGAIGAAIGPAIVAGMRSYRAAAREESESAEEEEDHEPRARAEERA